MPSMPLLLIICLLVSARSVAHLMSVLQTAGVTSSYEHHRRERFDLSSKMQERTNEHLVAWIMHGYGVEAGCVLHMCELACVRVVCVRLLRLSFCVPLLVCSSLLLLIANP